MKITKEIIKEIVSLCEIMFEGRVNGTITQNTYSEKFKPLLTEFKNKFGESPNLFLQDELKMFYNSQFEKLNSNISYKSFGFWGRTIYNYAWSCIYYDFGKEAIPASYSPQLYIVVNKYGIKFGFCYGNYIEDNDEMVMSALKGIKFSLLKKCFENDPEILFINSAIEEITASPEKLFGDKEKVIFKTDDEIINNWSSRSLLIKEFEKERIPDNIGDIIQSTFLSLSDFFKSLLPIDNFKIADIKNKETNPVPFSIITVNSKIKLSGLHISDKLLSRFTSSLLTKPFVILTGLSGSGKTKLAHAFAMWICEHSSQYCIVPVGADWTNREPLLGFPNALKDKDYVKPDNGVLDLILDANKNTDKPYFLILDEMNLSHVERYFADFLSVMESKNKIALHSGDSEWNNVPTEIGFPKNLFIIGTVNIDETTYMFSPKVLDRASVIEFRVTEKEMRGYLGSNSQINLEMLEAEGKGMAQDFVAIAKDLSLETNDANELNKALMSFFLELKKTGAEFGYRSASEILRFAAVVNKIDATWSVTDIIDAAIMQKLLPKLHGSRKKLSSVIITLSKLCIENCSTDFKDKDEAFLETYFSAEKEIAVGDATKIIYPLSFEKLVRMYHNLINNGFTSYAEA
ncbi:MAG: DUF3578 domain-containing protein [Saprospiraceae bacterium]